MDYKNTIINLLIEDRDMLSSDMDLYNRYNNIINSLRDSINDRDKLKDIDINDINIINDSDIKEFVTSLLELFNSGIIINSDELSNRVTLYSVKIEDEMNTREEIIRYREKIRYINKLFNVIENNYDSDILLLINYIRDCYRNKRIDINTYIDINLYLLVKKSELYNENVDNSVFVVIEENKYDSNIRERLVNLFDRYGFDYNLIGDTYKERIEKYAKIENIGNVLDMLSKYNLDSKDIDTYQKNISMLFIYYDSDAINNVCEFLNNNPDTSIDVLLRIDSVFFSRKRKYKIKDSNGKINIGRGKDFVSGDSQGFIDNINIYKKLLGKDSDYLMTNDDFRDREIFFSTPNEVIRKNLSILNSYGIISFDKNDGLIDKDGFYKNSSCFAGRNIEYILDRCIESNLYDYVKRYKNILSRTSFPLIWYKIKRAYSLNDNIRVNDSDMSDSKLKAIFVDDNLEYNGIFKKYKILNGYRKCHVIQNVMSMEDLVRGKRSYPNPYGNPYYYAEREYGHFYKYKTYNTFNILDLIKKKDYINNYSYIKEKVNSVNDILNDYYSREKNLSSDIFDNSLISYLDNNNNIAKGISINKSSNGLAYIFNIDSSDWPSVSVMISRPKVLKICSLLEKEGLWINENSGYEEIFILVLTTITKDTVLSEAEMESLRVVAKYIAGNLYKDIKNVKGVRKC